MVAVACHSAGQLIDHAHDLSRVEHERRVVVIGLVGCQWPEQFDQPGAMHVELMQAATVGILDRKQGEPIVRPHRRLREYV